MLYYIILHSNNIQVAVLCRGKYFNVQKPWNIKTSENIREWVNVRFVNIRG